MEDLAAFTSKEEKRAAAEESKKEEHFSAEGQSDLGQGPT